MLAEDKVADVTAISVTPVVKAALLAYCHFTTFPVCPERVIADGVVFWQIVVVVVFKTPATVAVLTVINCVIAVVEVLQTLSILLTQYVVFEVGLTVIEAVCSPEMMFEPTVPVPHS